MTKAFILIEVAVGKISDVVTALNSIDGVNSANTVTGPYDIIAIVEGADTKALSNLVITKIHTMDGVLRTITCFAMTPTR